MLHNYFLTATRTLWRRRGQTAINVLGLAVGLAACLLIGRYVADGWSYDDFHAQADRTVRVTSHLDIDGDPVHLLTSQGPLAPAMKEDLPDVAETVRFISGGYLLQHETTQVQVGNLFYTDPTVFDVFSFDLLQGDRETALDAPHSILLTPDLARQFFGDADPVGRTLQPEQGPALTVTGVIDNPPQTSHVQFEALVSMETRRTFDAQRFTNWGQFSYWTYALLEPGATAESLSDALPGVLERNTDGGIQDALTYEVMPLTDIYLQSDGLFQIGPTGDATALRIFLAVAVFILLIAGINFVNLSTARATERAREVGVRKTLGAPRTVLVGQFLAEAVVTALVALGVALLLAFAALPLFESIANTTLARGLIPDASVALLLVGATVGVGLASGVYPALVLAGYQPVRVLRGAFGRSGEGRTLRKGLVVTQFAIAIALIASTGVVQQQLDFVQNQDLGFSPSQLVALGIDEDPAMSQRLPSIQRELAAIPGVQATTASTYVPGAGQDLTGFEVESPRGTMRTMKAHRNDVGMDFVETYDIEVLAGRSFSTAFPSDTTQAVVINAAAAKHFGYTEPSEAVGRQITDNADRGMAEIVGVVDNFHYNSLHEAVEPLVLLPNGAPGADPSPSFVTLRVATDEISGTMDAVQARWSTLAPDRPYEATFLDQYFAELYEQDRRFGHLFATFAGLAVFVACLGLFGLATHTVQQRTKEIGIRKALGATAASLVRLLSQDFATLVGLAFVVGVPVAYLGMSRWLETFAYRIDLGVGVFALAGGIALVIALGTVGGQAWRAAMLDPTAALRDE